MAIAFVNSTSATGTGVNALTVVTPGSLTVGNVLLWTVGRLDPGSLITLPAGWQWLTDGLSQGGLDVNLLYRVVDGTEAVNYTVQLNAVCTVVFGEIGQYSGVNATYPIYSQQGVIYNFFEGASDTFFFDQVGCDDTLNAAFTYQVAMVATLSATTFTVPAGYSTQYAATVTNGADNLSVGVYDAVGYGEGLSATLTITGGAATSPYIGFRIFLRPAGTTEPTLTWTIFDPIVVPPFTNWPFLLLDTDGSALYAVYPTNPTGSTILEKFDALTRTSLLTATFAADVPVGDKVMAQDATHLYVALADKTVRKILKADLTQTAISGAAASSFDNLSVGGTVLWASDNGGVYFQFNTTTLASTSFDDTGSGRNIVGLTADGAGNAWALTYNGTPEGVFVFVDAAFATTTYNITFADLPIDNAFGGGSYAALGRDATTGYLWALVYNAEDNSVPNPCGLLVWDTATQTTVNAFTYGKTAYVGGSSVMNALDTWDTTTRSLWIPFGYFFGLDQLALGTPGFADAVRFDQFGVFQEKVPIDFPPIVGTDLLEELQSTVISVTDDSQDMWMVLHTDDPLGNCIKHIAVISESLIPPPPPAATFSRGEVCNPLTITLPITDYRTLRPFL